MDWQFNPTNGVLTIYSTVPMNLTANIADNILQISWPADHLGWRLMMNTNDLSDPNAWFPVPNSAANIQLTRPFDATQRAVFFRLIYR